MKKVLIAGIMVCTIAIGAVAVYADTANTNRFQSRRGYGHMMTMNNRWDREIDFNSPKTDFNNKETEEEANERRRHFDEMDKFHEENGFSRGRCHDRNTSGRHGSGMMGRNRY